MEKVSVHVTKYLEKNGIISNDYTVWVFMIGAKEFPFAGFFGEALSQAHYSANLLGVREIELLY